MFGTPTVHAVAGFLRYPRDFLSRKARIRNAKKQPFFVPLLGSHARRLRHLPLLSVRVQSYLGIPASPLNLLWRTRPLRVNRHSGVQPLDNLTAFMAFN
jgi:hypothetical protein